ncbi:MAG: DUF1217 domain-containing protein [Rhizobiales bacterium]|nr:DUF1217 domain-containing protein [Hyphomicrobiales bacterium]
MDAVLTYKLFAADSARALERIQSKPQVSREVEYYKENITSIKSIDALIDDDRIFATVMEAYGLEEMTYAKGFVRKLLEGGIDDEDSMANRLTDPRYQELAEDFNFVRNGEATTAFSKVTVGVIDKFYQQNLEVEAGNQNAGVRLAMYFQRKAEDIETPLNILADAALLQFVQTTFAMPTAMSYQSLDKQVELIEDKFDIEDLKDPEKIEEMVSRFLTGWDMQNPTSVSIPPILSNPNAILNISIDTLSAIQNLKTRF